MKGITRTNKIKWARTPIITKFQRSGFALIVLLIGGFNLEMKSDSKIRRLAILGEVPKTVKLSILQEHDTELHDL